MSNDVALTPLHFEIRHFIYSHFVAHSRPPSPAETARQFALSPTEATAAYHVLHDNHFIFLEPGTDKIRMANPLSAIPTDFVVAANGQSYFANCAWDMLGIPAMLKCDANIKAICADCGETIKVQVKGGTVYHQGQLVHFALPVKDWYNDLIET